MTTRGQINSNFYQIVDVDIDGNPISIKNQYIANANVEHANIANVANSVTVGNVVGIGNIATINLNGNSQTFLAGNGGWLSPSASTSNYANYAGNIVNASQPNITSLGTLSGLTSTGNITAPFFIGNVVGNISGNLVVPGSNTDIIYNNDGNAGASDNLQFNSATNVLTLTGNLHSTNANLGNLAEANYFSGSGNLLSNIQVGNITGLGNIATINLNGSTSNVLLGDGTWGALPSTANANYANYAGNITISDQPNITSLGTLTSLTVTGNITSGNASLGNLASANYISGNANLVTGLSLTGTNFTDVAVSSPVNQQVLQYNGVNWVNNTLSIPTSAGSGVTFWFTSPVILAQGANNDIQLDTLNDVPNTSAIQYATRSINTSTQVVSGVVTLPLGRTQFDAGNWDFSIWANANSSGGTTSIQPATYQVNPGNGTTITITGTGTSRTATASGGTPFVNSVGSANVLLASYIQTPTGLFQITAKTSSTIVTITTPTTYTNESIVSYFVYDLFYSLPSKTISNTLSEYIFTTTTSSLAINTTTRLGILVIGTTTNTRTISVSYNDSSQASHVNTPFITLHDNLAGLQGGQSTEYYHLTNSEYTGTGTGNFVRQTSPTLTTPNIGIASGTSLSVTGNISSGNANLGNLAISNYFSGTLTTNAQPNITSLGTLSSLIVSGTGNINLLNVTAAAGDEGGELHLAKPITNTTLAGDIAIDVYQNKVRFFENGGTNRGAYIDISAAGAGVSSNLLAGSGGTPGGSNTQLQFNNNGTFGGISTVTWNGTNVSLGAINTVKITGGIANDVIRTDGTGNLSFQAIATSLTVGTRTTPVTIPTTNYQMNVLARTGNVVVSVN